MGSLYYNFVRIHKTLRTTPAMAANITKRLWEIGDIVDVLEAFENPQGRRASYNAKQCLDKATECERIASQVKARDAKATLIEIAQQWRELVRQKEEIEWDRPQF